VEVPAVNIVGDDEQDTVLLRKMSEDAKQYIPRFRGARPFLTRILEAVWEVFSQFSSSTFAQAIPT
jgi:hypothetical protein